MKEQIEKIGAELARLFPNDFIKVEVSYMGGGVCGELHYSSCHAIALRYDCDTYDFDGEGTLDELQAALWI